MTAFSAIRSGKTPRGGNIKEGHSPSRRQTKVQRQADEDQWLTAGFSYQGIRNAPRLTYTWQGNFPVFEVSPGIITDATGTHAGMVARYAPADVKILFPYGTPPADIKARLDVEILAIMLHDADTQPAPLPGEWIPF